MPLRSPAASRRDPAVIAAVVAVGILLVLRLWFIGVHPIDSDEPQNLHVIYQWWRGALIYRDQFDNHTPFFHWIFLPFAGLVGETPHVIVLARLALIPLSFGVLAVLYLLFRTLFSQVVSLWSLAICLALADWTLKSIEVRPDVLWSLLWFLAVLVLVRWGRRPGFLPFLTAGLLLGAAAMASVKTIFLLPALAAGWAGAWILNPELRRLFGWSTIGRCALGGLLGVIAVPVATGVAFAMAGGLDEMIYCVFSINKDPLLTPRALIFAVGMIAAFGLCAAFPAAWSRSSGEDDQLRAAYRQAIFLTGACYTLAIIGFGPGESLAKQTFMASYPLLIASACHFVLSLRTWSPTQTTALGGGICGILLVLMVVGSPPWRDSHAEYRSVLASVLSSTEPDDPLLDLKGETIFRRRPLYMAFVGNTVRKMEAGQIPVPSVDPMIENEVVYAIERTSSFPETIREFLRSNYIETTGELRVAGVLIKPDWVDGKWVAAARPAIPGRYLVVEAGAVVSEVEVGGRLPVELAFETRGERVLVHSAAWNAGWRPEVGEKR